MSEVLCVTVCQQDGCTRPAVGDAFCSTECAKAYYAGGEEERQEYKRKERNRRRRENALRKKMGSSIEVDNSHNGG